MYLGPTVHGTDVVEHGRMPSQRDVLELLQVMDTVKVEIIVAVFGHEIEVSDAFRLQMWMV